MLFLSFFFFQAEDGIRDGHVTGVQTCALPISVPRSGSSAAPRVPDAKDNKDDNSSPEVKELKGSAAIPLESLTAEGTAARSEERRVGKESRCRRGGEREKEKR